MNHRKASQPSLRHQLPRLLPLPLPGAHVTAHARTAPRDGEPGVDTVHDPAWLHDLQVVGSGNPGVGQREPR
jgi:hypothetical protein